MFVILSLLSGLLSAEDINDSIIQCGNVKQASFSPTVAFSRLSISRGCRRPTSADPERAGRRWPRTEPDDWSIGRLCCEHYVWFCRRLFREAAETYLPVDIPAERSAWCHRHRFRPGSHVHQRWSKGKFSTGAVLRENTGVTPPPPPVRGLTPIGPQMKLFLD